MINRKKSCLQLLPFLLQHLPNHQLRNPNPKPKPNPNPNPNRNFVRVIQMSIQTLSQQKQLVLPLQVYIHIKNSFSEEADFFRALSGSASKQIPSEMLRQLGWSEARIKAFRNREKNPNQYYYRFNNPGEPQATGKWSAKDKALFLKLIKERKVDYQVFVFTYNFKNSGEFSPCKFQEE